MPFVSRHHPTLDELMDVDPSESWLENWHDRRRGATSRAFLRGKPSSYDWLAEHARSGDRVLDLACGDGALLEVLRGRGIDDATGIDMSEGELAAARERLGAGAKLVRGRAQQLPFEDGSFDLVTCHLALMLMRPVDEVIAEVRRVLRPKGKFVAVVGGGGAVSTTEDAWTLLVRRLRDEPFRGPPIGDKRTFREEGLRELLRDFAEVSVEPLRIELPGTPDEIIALFHETYDAERMDPERLRPFEEAVRGDWQAISRADGTLPCSFEMTGLAAST